MPNDWFLLVIGNETTTTCMGGHTETVTQVHVAYGTDKAVRDSFTKKAIALRDRNKQRKRITFHASIKSVIIKRLTSNGETLPEKEMEEFVRAAVTMDPAKLKKALAS
jgi:predicted oxidoreductase